LRRGCHAPLAHVIGVRIPDTQPQFTQQTTALRAFASVSNAAIGVPLTAESSEAVLAAGESESGASVHLVDAGHDTGAVVRQGRIPVLPEDTVESLKAPVSYKQLTLPTKRIV
jgi:folate-dependent phosphoribosylglycinamide formyltransferase PurN